MLVYMYNSEMRLFIKNKMKTFDIIEKKNDHNDTRRALN